MNKKAIIKQYIIMAICSVMPTLISVTTSWVLLDVYTTGIGVPLILLLLGAVLSCCISIKQLKNIQCKNSTKVLLFILQPSTIIFVGIVLIAIALSISLSNGFCLNFGPPI